jgi:hypothetical protein
VLADITKGLGNALPVGQQHIDMPLQELQPKQPEKKQELDVSIESKLSNKAPSTNSRITSDTTGDLTMWDKLTAGDIERIKRGFATRRTEMLTRHAEELRGLEAQQAEIDAVEKAIAVFTQKFKLTSSADVVPFDAERAPVHAG